MSGATYNDVDSFGNLKELYAEDSHYQENVVSSFFNFIRHADDGEVEFDGKNYNIAVVLQHNESYGALNDDERIPDSDFPKGVFAKYGPKRMYSGVEATTFAATRGHKNGRVDGKYLDDMIRGTLLTFMSNLDSDALGNGRGYRATVATATAAQTSFTVDFSGRLRPGMKLDWYDSTLATKRGSIKIALRGIDRVNRTVYVDTTFGSAAVPTGAALRRARRRRAERRPPHPRLRPDLRQQRLDRHALADRLRGLDRHQPGGRRRQPDARDPPGPIGPDEGHLGSLPRRHGVQQRLEARLPQRLPQPAHVHLEQLRHGGL
jgi:hypothetical protein